MGPKPPKLCPLKPIDNSRGIWAHLGLTAAGPEASQPHPPHSIFPFWLPRNPPPHSATPAQLISH